ncbi:hypothetical protein KSP40_PGU015706 [Platanthera guangdongensis]|uniref:Uncharacterized protein n=1 Tax=Platanthera guangdongensis TaxID=2320717 RepID=A0ABR2LX21_9ASPA
MTVEISGKPLFCSAKQRHEQPPPFRWLCPNSGWQQPPPFRRPAASIDSCQTQPVMCNWLPFGHPFKRPGSKGFTVWLAVDPIAHSTAGLVYGARRRLYAVDNFSFSLFFLSITGVSQTLFRSSVQDPCNEIGKEAIISEETLNESNRTRAELLLLSSHPAEEVDHVDLVAMPISVC